MRLLVFLLLGRSLNYFSAVSMAGTRLGFTQCEIVDQSAHCFAYRFIAG